MRLRKCVRLAALGGTGRPCLFVSVILFLVGITVTSVSAGDVSAQPTDSLSVVGSTTATLPQYQPTQPENAPAARASATSGPAESSWQSRFHVTGYLNQVPGMWFKSFSDPKLDGVA
jgi:hypothetical protein